MVIDLLVLESFGLLSAIERYAEVIRLASWDENLKVHEAIQDTLIEASNLLGRMSSSGCHG